jgi:hypothetical protein
MDYLYNWIRVLGGEHHINLYILTSDTIICYIKDTGKCLLSNSSNFQHSADGGFTGYLKNA